MQALQFDFKLQKYALTKMLGRIFPTIYWNSAFSCVQLSKIEEPSLPNEEWVKMKVKQRAKPSSNCHWLKNHGLTITGYDLDDIFERMDGKIERNIPMH